MKDILSFKNLSKLGVEKSQSKKLLFLAGGTIGSKDYQNPRFPPDIVETLEHDDISKLVSPYIKGHAVDFFDMEGNGNFKHLVKDSKLFSEKDIKELASIINNTEHDYNIITHGTDQVARNAELFKEIHSEHSDNNKVIAFVSSMIPLSMHNKRQYDGSAINSDAVNSLSYTLNNIEEQPPGVYVVARNLHTQRLGFHEPSSIDKNWFESKASLEFTVHNR